MSALFFDIDGTIRGKSREITKRNKEAICKLRENGHKAEKSIKKVQKHPETKKKKKKNNKKK